MKLLKKFDENIYITVNDALKALTARTIDARGNK